MIYLDNAATTAMSEAALSALVEVSAKIYGNPSSIYSFGRATKEILEKSRKIIANCISADPEEIFFTSCGTESDNWVMEKATVGKELLITSSVEHHAILHPAEMQRGNGRKVIYLPVDDRCVVKQSSLIDELQGKPAFVSVILQNNETGVIQNIKSIAKMVHEDNPDSILHTDAVQAVGHIKIDVKEMGIDLMSASAHKFNGPKGVGFLYVNKACSLLPFILGGGQEKGMRSGTENVAGIYSMAKALEDNVEQIETIHNHIANLEKLFLELMTTENIRYKINGDNDNRAVGILNISISGMEGEGLLNMLDMHDICISIGSACNSKSQERSHVLTAMGFNNERIDSSVRISIGRYNTEEDIRTLVKWIANYNKIAALAKA